MLQDSFGKVLCFGESLWDCFPEGNFPGGAPMNVAIHLNKLGIAAALLSRVGNDEWGRGLRDFMVAHGLEPGLIQTDQKHETGKVKVDLSNPGQAKYDIVSPVAWDFIQYPLDKNLFPDNFDIVVFGSLAARNTISRETLFALLDHAPFKIFDVNLRYPHYNEEIIHALMKRADLVKMNEEELVTIGAWNKISGSEENMLPKIAEKFNIRLLCITKGEKGAIAWTENQYTAIPGFKVPLVDSIGAGDAFIAGLIKQLLGNKAVKWALEYACATGAWVASHRGANPDYQVADIAHIMENVKKVS